MTDRSSPPRAGRRRRRHPAAGSRVLATGISVAAVLGLTAGWAATSTPPAPADPSVRAVVTDGRISSDVAARAAVTAAAAGRTRAHVQLTSAPGDGRSARPDVTSRAS